MANAANKGNGAKPAGTTSKQAQRQLAASRSGVRSSTKSRKSPAQKMPR